MWETDLKVTRGRVSEAPESVAQVADVGGTWNDSVMTTPPAAAATATRASAAASVSGTTGASAVAARVDLKMVRKARRGPKKPRVLRETRFKNEPHVATRKPLDGTAVEKSKKSPSKTR